MKFDASRMVFVLGEGEDLVEIPARYEVCGRCMGKGSHVNPAIDGNGITMEEWHNEWSHEEQEAYMSGRYDVGCYECHGNRVVPVADEKTASQEQLDQYNEYCEMVAFDRSIEESERRFGC